MWEDLVYTKAQAKYRYNEIINDPENLLPVKPKESYESLRGIILEEKKQILTEDLVKINSYYFDLQLGLKLYVVLNKKYEFNERYAAQDEIWRYLSLEVFPDLVYERVKDSSERFYANGRRIWLKRIWWYIHLSWQGSYEKTYEVLKDNTSDEILQLVDRSGSGGYRIDLTREIMRRHSLVSRKPRFLRRVLKLNVTRLKISEPYLVVGGTSTYVEELYDYFRE